MPDVFEKCYFLDVGQGSSSVILTPDDRAIIVDAGPLKQSTLWNFLSSVCVKRIECVLLSHNDTDHIRGFEKIAETYGAMIGAVYVLRDREKTTDTYDAVMSLFHRGIVPRPRRAEVRDLKETFTVFENEHCSMELLYPDFLANEDALAAGNPNRSSVIAKVTCHERTAIIFPGDSTLDSWRDIEEHASCLPIKTDVLVVPHHGGMIGKSAEDIEWFTDSAVRPKYAVVSVGSDNSYEHPRREVLETLRSKNIHIICTEITGRCHASVVSLNPSVLAELLPYSRCSETTDLSHIGCAGTIVAELQEKSTKVIRVQKHRNQIRAKVDSAMCLSTE